jgi:hypothetical protein
VSPEHASSLLLPKDGSPSSDAPMLVTPGTFHPNRSTIYQDIFQARLTEREHTTCYFIT